MSQIRPTAIKNDAGLSPECRFLWDYLFAKGGLKVSMQELLYNCNADKVTVDYMLSVLESRGLLVIEGEQMAGEETLLVFRIP